MSIRIDVQVDHESESLRYVATATLDGKRLHEVGEYGGPEVGDVVFKKMTAWLKVEGYEVPDCYWKQKFAK